MHYLLRALCWRLLTRRWKMLITIMALICFSMLLVQAIMWWEKYAGRGEKDEEMTNFDKFLDVNPLFAFNRSGPFAQTLQFCNFPPVTVAEPLFNKSAKHLASPETMPRLLQLHIFTRDGIRAPTHLIELNEIPTLQTRFNCTMNSLQKMDQLQAPKYLHQLYQNKTNSSGLCESGELLPMGALQMFLLGKSLMQRYFPSFISHKKLGETYLIDRSKFVASVGDWLHLKSTEYSRTRLSVQAFHLGFLSALNEPGFSRYFSGKASEPSTSKVLESFEDAPTSVEIYQSLAFCDRRYERYKDCACPRLRSYHTEVLQQKGKLHREHGASQIRLLRSLWREIHKANVSPVREDSKTTAPEVWERLSVSDLVNLLWPMICSSSRTVRLQERQVCFQDSLDQSLSSSRISGCVPVPLLETALTLHNVMERKLTSHNSFRRYSRLAMYPLLSQLVKNTQKEFTGTNLTRTHSSFPQVHVYSGHDQTIRMLLSAISETSQEWPPFGAHLVLEVYGISGATSSRTSPQQVDGVFRLLYGSENLTSKLSYCKDHLWSPPSSSLLFCRMRALDEYLNSGYWSLFASKDFRRECS